jgi:TolB-like protein
MDESYLLSPAIRSDLTDNKNKKKDKVRSAWIAFVGRIVAQFVGAAASILLALMVVQQYQTPRAATSEGELRKSSATTQLSPAVRERHGTDRTSVAVLPLEDFSPAGKQDQLANVMTEALIAALSQTGGLKVISRTSSMHYKGAGQPLPMIARALAVDWIVEGSVLVVGGRVRVIAQLIDAVSDEHIWAATYDRPFGDLLSLQSGLASAMARDVEVAIQRERQRLTAPARRLAARVD